MIAFDLRVACILLWVGVITVFSPFTVFAHEERESYETVVEGHMIDIGYDPKQLKPDGLLALDFALSDTSDASKGTTDQFDSVWTRIAMNGEVQLAVEVARASVGETRLLYQIPKQASGPLQVYVRYQRGGKPIAETSFVLPVDETSSVAESVMVIVLSFLAIMFGTFGYEKLRVRNDRAAKHGDL